MTLSASLASRRVPGAEHYDDGSIGSLLLSDVLPVLLKGPAT